MLELTMTSRRNFIQLAACRFLSASAYVQFGASGLVMADLNALPQDVAKQRSIEEWMNEWMNSANRGEEGALYLSRFVEPIYFLTKTITWTPNADQRGYQPVTVPVGFVTDLASIPRVFWSLLRPDGEYTYPAIIHDYMYWTQARPRETADMIFKLGMQDFGVSPATIATIYNAVRAGGGSSWDDNRRLQRAGERRVLKVFPDNPRARWADWKKRPDVFEDR
jgi:hypothetical protein